MSTQNSLLIRTASNDDLASAKVAFGQTHGGPIMRAVLFGFAGVAPRSAMPNLTELLSTVVAKYPLESKQWMTDILFAVRLSDSLVGRNVWRSPTSCLAGGLLPMSSQCRGQEQIHQDYLQVGG